jgi:hypothetical protein
VKNLRPIIGLVILLLIVAAVSFGRGLLAPKGKVPAPASPVAASTVTGIWGSDKDVLINDPDIKRILADKYHLEVAGGVLSQFNLKPTDVQDKDFVWHSSRVSVDEYKRKGYPVKKEAVIVRTPLVIYAWQPVTAALSKSKLIAMKGRTYYVTDLPRLTSLIVDGKPWSQLGLSFYGPINIYSTDPRSTNSGMLYYALVATELNKGQLLSEASMNDVMPRLKAFYAGQGAMDSKNQWLLEAFLQKGAGENPMIVTWESELQEYVLSHPSDAAFVKKNVQVLYPQPTIWSDHIFIAETDKGARLLQALQDPEIQKLAWEKHGFRTGLSGTRNDPGQLQALGIPDTIDSAIPTPRPEVMIRIKTGL